MTEQPLHAPLPPSGANWWMRCTLMTHLLKTEGDKLPKEKPSIHALAGTKAHDWNHKILHAHFTQNYKFRGKVAKLFDELEDEDEEMYSYTKDYFEWLIKAEKRFLGGLKKDYLRLLEEKVYFAPNNWGTLDYGLVTDRNGELQAFICDYKYGRGKEVTAKKNLQLINYALGLDQKYDHKIAKFFLFIYQPRTAGKPEDKWVMTTTEKLKWEGRFNKKIEEHDLVQIGKLAPKACVGDWCGWCPAHAICPAVKESIKEEAMLEIDQVDFNPPSLRSLNIEQLVQIYNKAPEIEDFLSSIATYLLERAKNGLKVPGYKLVGNRQIRKWTPDIESIGKALKKLGVKEPFRQKLINITDAERLLGKGVIDPYTTKSDLKLQLVPEADKRDEITSEVAALLTDT